jgi:hypothetical protein
MVTSLPPTSKPSVLRPKCGVKYINVKVLHSYRLQVLRSDHLGNLLELKFIKIADKENLSGKITIVNDEIRHRQGSVITHGIGPCR